MKQSKAILWIKDKTYALYQTPRKKPYQTKNLPDLKARLKDINELYLVTDDIEIEYTKVTPENWREELKIRFHSEHLIKNENFYNILKVQNLPLIEDKKIKGVFAYSHILFWLVTHGEELKNHWNIILQNGHLVVSKEDLILFEIKNFKDHTQKEIKEYLYRFGYEDKEKIQIFSDQKKESHFKELPEFPYDLFKALNDHKISAQYNLKKAKLPLSNIFHGAGIAASFLLLIYPLITHSTACLQEEKCDQNLHNFLRVVVKLEEVFGKKSLCERIEYKPKKFQFTFQNAAREFFNPKLFETKYIQIENLKAQGHAVNEKVVLQFHKD